MAWPESVIGVGILLDIATLVVRAAVGVLIGRHLPVGTGGAPHRGDL